MNDYELKISKIKDDLQEQLSVVWKNADYVGTIQGAAGFGKTILGCKIAAKIIAAKNSRKILMIMPSAVVEKQWKDTINESFPSIKNNVLIYTIDTLLNNQTTEIFSCYAVIIDEIHEFYSDLRGEFLNRLASTIKYRLGLTATYYDKGREKIISNSYPLVATLTRDMTINLGITANTLEYNIPLELLPQDAVTYKKLSDAIAIQLAKFNGSLQTAQACLGNFGICVGVAKSHGWEKGCADDINKAYNPQILMGQAKLLMLNIRRRLDLLYDNVVKLDAGLTVLKHFKGVKTICFSENADFIDLLVDEANQHIYKDDFVADLFGEPILNLPVIAIHSKIKTKFLPVGKNGAMKKCGLGTLKKIAIERMNNNSATVICGVHSLDRGLDIPSLKFALSFSGTQNPIQYTQRRGRVERIDFQDEAKLSVIINLYFKNTQDEKSLNSRQKLSKHKVMGASISNLNTIII